MDRFCYDSAVTCRWQMGPWGFFALTRLAPIHWGSFCIQHYLNAHLQVLQLPLSTLTTVDIFDNSPFGAWCIFDIKITGTESTKPKLRMIACDSIRTINTIHIFNHLDCVFAFTKEKISNMGYFLIVVVHLWRVKKYRLSWALAKSIKFIINSLRS